MKLTREIVEAIIAGYLFKNERPVNGWVERSKHQRRRGRPPLLTAEKKAKKRKYTKRSKYWKS